MSVEVPEGWGPLPLAPNGDPMYFRQCGPGVSLAVGLQRRPFARGWPKMVTVGKTWKRRRVLPTLSELDLVQSLWGLERWHVGPSSRHLRYLSSAPLTPPQLEALLDALAAT